jgi:hypothetical protein
MKFLKILPLILAGAFLLNACQKEYSVENGGLKVPAGNWEFKDSGMQYIGTLDTAFIVKQATGSELHLTGKSADGNQNFNLTLYADTFKIGSYKASLFQSSLNYSGSGKMIYQASELYGEFIVNILSINANLITGSFAGIAKDTSGVLKQLFDGKFKAVFPSLPVVPVSVGILGNSAGNCEPVVLNGVYQQGISTTASNTVQVQVTVASPGTYTIFTDPVNGITFSNTATFTTTGQQSVLLNATGVPAFSGDQNFTLHYGNSQCAFKVTFLPGAAPSNDYYPLTINTDWTYGSGVDSFMYKVLPSTKNIGGNTYSILGDYDVPSMQFNDTAFYLRKNSGNYYSYMNLTNIFQFDQQISSEIIILKDNVAQGTSWTSSTVTGTIGNVPASVSFKFTILQKAVPAIVGHFNFTDVIKVKMDTFLNSMPVGSSEMWYSRNVGLIYINNGSATYQVGSFHIF